jgi:hypothetical protein
VTLSGAHARYFVIGTPPRTSTPGVHFEPGGPFPAAPAHVRDAPRGHLVEARLE